jgi:hypothetical protein
LRLKDLDLTWVEEPVGAEDLHGHRAVREAVRPVPIQTGENWWFPSGMANAVAAKASDLAISLLHSRDSSATAAAATIHRDMNSPGLLSVTR